MGGGDPADHEGLSALPAVHRLAVVAARRAIEERRVELLAGSGSEADLAERALQLMSASLPPTERIARTDQLRLTPVA